MSYETAKEALRQNIRVIMTHKDTVTAHDHFLYNMAKSLFDFIEALDADLGELKARLKVYESLPPQR
jgi:hypothetical protein